MNNTDAIAKAAQVNMLPQTRSQQKLVGEITSTEKGLSIVKNGFVVALTITGVATKTIEGKGVDIVPLSFGDGDTVNDHTGNLKLSDGVIYTGAVGDADAGITITAESQSEISIADFSYLLLKGAIRMQEAIIRTSGDKADIQVTQPLFLESLDFRGYDRDKLNMGVVKGQELSQANVLGPVLFPEDTVLGSIGSGLSYKLLGLTGAVNRTVVIELYFDNYISLPMLLKNLLIGDRLKKQAAQG